jgi:hypothetical protein
MFQSKAKRESISVKVSDIQYECPVDPNAPPATPEFLDAYFDSEKQMVIFVISNGANARSCTCPTEKILILFGRS